MSDFMFRDRELLRIQNALQHKESVLLVGIRRIGKTMLMNEIIRRHTGPGKVVHLDVSSYTSLYQFYSELLDSIPTPFLRRMVGFLPSLPDRLMNWVRRHVDRIDVVDLREPDTEAALIRYWEPIANAMLQAQKDPSVAGEIAFFAIDEFPFMLKNLLNRQVPVEEITVALAMLRKLRDGGIPMLLSGSISLENLLSLHAIPHTVLGGLHRESILPFNRDEAHSYLQTHLANSKVVTKIDVALDYLPDYIPSFLNTSVHYLRVLSAADNVDVVMENEVLPAIRRTFIEQFRERLSNNYPDAELPCAEQLLDQLAQAVETGAPIDTRNFPRVYNRVLTKLKYDMFIEEAPGHGYRFTLNALRLWWRNERGMA
ncbi:MAG: ATP-binding protein [Desulfobulbus sp.]|nr:ATP-binding protein [Desulfobulbus sp.]